MFVLSSSCCQEFFCFSFFSLLLQSDESYVPFNMYSYCSGSFAFQWEKKVLVKQPGVTHKVNTGDKIKKREQWEFENTHRHTRIEMNAHGHTHTHFYTHILRVSHTVLMINHKTEGKRAHRRMENGAVCHCACIMGCQEKSGAASFIKNTSKNLIPLKTSSLILSFMSLSLSLSLCRVQCCHLCASWSGAHGEWL